MEEDQVREQIGHEQFVVPDGIHKGVLRELVHIIARPFSIIFQRSW